MGPALKRPLNPEPQVQAVRRFLFQETGFHVPARDASAVRTGVRVEHPGVWEQPRYGYLHELLISRFGPGGDTSLRGQLGACRGLSWLNALYAPSGQSSFQLAGSTRCGAPDCTREAGECGPAGDG